ncbi:MAG: ROK family protein [Haemophilus parainfluenzae]|nr:ROK family protein [Haemophilus parainfluenzae]
MSLTVDSGQTLQRCLALDIGGTKIASAIVKNGEIQQRKQISTPQDDAAQAMHQTLAQLLKEYEGQFDYVAVASTGIINQGILTALNLILNHRLLTEPNGIAGHIGHTLADPNGPVCGCGRRGCVEAIASGRAIEAVSSQWDEPCDPKEVFARFRQNDEKATALVTRSAQAIANLIADLKIGLDMQKVVVGGSVGLAEGYLPLVQSLLSELPAVYHCELESAQFGQDAGLIGAAYWVKDCLLQAKNTGVVYG